MGSAKIDGVMDWVRGILKPIVQEALREEMKSVSGPHPEVTQIEILKRKEYLEGKEVELLYGLKDVTLKAWRQQGRGPSYTQDGERRRVLYKRSDVEAWMKSFHVKTYDQQGG